LSNAFVMSFLFFAPVSTIFPLANISSTILGFAILYMSPGNISGSY